MKTFYVFFSHQHYASVLDLLKGMSKEDKWKNHTSDGADSLTKKQVRAIFEAPIHDPVTKSLCLVRLRNKALSILMIVNGWHTKDAKRVMDSDVEDHPDYRDRDKVHRPKMLFRGRKCKQHILVKNTVGCGCLGTHTDVNTNCFYNVLKWYLVMKQKSDKHFCKVATKEMSKRQRKGHFNDDGTLKDRQFFRSHPKKNPMFYPHRNQGITSIQGALEFWNKELGLSDKALTTNQARKTFCTFGHKHTASNWC